MMNTDNQTAGDPLLAMVPQQQKEEQQQWFDAELVLAKDGFDINQQAAGLPWGDLTEYLNTLEEFNSVQPTAQLDRADENFMDLDLMDTLSFLSNPACPGGASGGSEIPLEEEAEDNDSLISIEDVTKPAVINRYVNGIETIQYTLYSKNRPQTRRQRQTEVHQSVDLAELGNNYCSFPPCLQDYVKFISQQYGSESLERDIGTITNIVYHNRQRYSLYDVQAAVTTILQSKPRLCIEYILKALVPLVEALAYSDDCPVQAPDGRHKMGGRFFKSLYSWLTNENTVKKIQTGFVFYE